MPDKEIGRYVMSYQITKSTDEPFTMGLEVNKDSEGNYRFDLYYITKTKDGKERWQFSNDIISIPSATLISQIIPDIIKMEVDENAKR